MAFDFREPSWAKRIVPELELLDDLGARDEIWNFVRRCKHRRILYWLGAPIWLGPLVWTLSFVGSAVVSRSGSQLVVTLCIAVLCSQVIGWWEFGSYWLLRKRIARLVRVQLLERGVRVCLECGYDLRAHEQMRCPECGWREAEEPAV